MKSPLFGRIAVIGSGLIGGSAAASAVAENIACHVSIHDTSADGMEWLLQHKFVHSIHSTPAAAVNEADLVILATPPGSLGGIASAIGSHLKPGCIVTDVTSVKRKAIADIMPHISASVFFVPGHPIAGKEVQGAAAAEPTLFQHKKVILTPEESQVLSEQVGRVRGFWEATGATVELMPPSLHDHIYAYISHLPQLVAFSAFAIINSNADACSGLLRLAASPTPLWSEIVQANGDFIRSAIDEYCIFLTQMTQELREPDESEDEKPVEDASALTASVLGLCLVATALLLEQRTGIQAMHYAGSGFRDITRSAGSSSDVMLAAISSQPRIVADKLQIVLDKLHRIASAISSGLPDRIQAAIKT